MRALLASVGALLGSAALLLLANGMQGSLLAYRAGIEGFAPLAIGGIMTCYSLGFVLGTRRCPAVIERVGHIRAFAAFAAVVSTVSVLHGVLVGPVVWFALRFLGGLCTAGLMMVIDSWLNSRAQNQNRGTLLAFYMVINLGANGTGQQLLTVATPDTILPFVLGSCLFSLALVPIALSQAVAPSPIPTRRLGIRALYAISPLGLAGAFAAGLGGSAFWGMAPVFGQQAGLGLDQTALFLTAVLTGGALVQWPVGWLSDHIDRRAVLTGAALALALAALAVAHTPAGWLLPMAVVFGGCQMVIYSLSVAHTQDSMVEGNALQASSGLLFVWASGSILGPLLAAGTMSLLGPQGLFFMITATAASLGAFGLFRMTVRAAPSAAERGPFVVVPQTSPAGKALDPRLARPAGDDRGALAEARERGFAISSRGSR
ncbi:MFS transporter [Marinivivus vitaminiproducens]|uniref:MFS transporter n=1 Tax=Marinivivus vitaminiproducens TaxID=3035935 RepID=UPI00279B1016|nr:MFS transporter [Geminicoccaceae bacterium SCSIO 64248]